MTRVCPHSDKVCNHGMLCPYTCASEQYDGTKEPMYPGPSTPLTDEERAGERGPLLAAAKLY